MTTQNRGKKVTASFAFKLLESIGMQGISFVVSLVIARLLDPSDYGVLTMLTVFIAIAQVFVQSGLNTALIQKKDVTVADCSSVFWMSLSMSAILYAILYFTSPYIANYYNMPSLAPVLPVLAIILFPGALLSVQNAIVAREMAFRTLMVCSLISTLVSGWVGIILALYGAGYWALVAQQLINQCLLCILLLFTIKWRPAFVFEGKRVWVLFSFGWKLLVASLLETGYNNLRSLVIGKYYTPEALGLYNRGKQFPELMMNAVNGSIQSVMFPVLSESQTDIERMKALLKRSITMSSFIVLPAMAGLAAVAKPLVTVLLTEKWLLCVPFLQICCIDFAFYPIHTANLQAINALGRSDVFLKLEIIKKTVGVIILAVTLLVFKTIEAIAWGAVVSTLIAAVINSWPNRKFIGYGYIEQMKDIMPSMLMAIVMFIVVNLLNGLGLPVVLLLVVQIIVGIICYVGMAMICARDLLKYMITQLKRLLKKGGDGK